MVSLKHQLAERDGKLKAARTDALEARMALQQKDVELKAAFAQLSEAVHDRSVMRTQLAQVGWVWTAAAESCRVWRQTLAADQWWCQRILCASCCCYCHLASRCGDCLFNPAFAQAHRAAGSLAAVHSLSPAPYHAGLTAASLPLLFVSGLQTHAELAETRAELEQLADDILAIKELMEDEDEELGLSDNNKDSESYTYYSPAAAEEQYAAAEPPPAAFGDGDEALDILQSLASLSRQLVEDATEDDAILDSMAQSWSAAPRPEA